MKISIIIPSYNKWELTNQRLIELNQWCGDRIHQVVLIDDASEEAFGHLNFWKEVLPWVYYRNETNMGFGKSMNKGAEIATGDIFVFLSNDVLIRSDFTQEITQLISANKEILIGAELLQHDTGWNVFNNTIIPYLHGWFLACHRDVWEKLGGFDWELYGASDYEDIDLCVAAHQNNIMLVQLKNQVLKHLVARTFGYTDERRERTEGNKIKFAKKWNDILF